MRERHERFFDSLVWAAVILFDAVMMLNFVAAGWLTVQKFGGDHGDLALVGAAYWITYAPLCPLMARVAARVGLRKMSVFGTVVLIISAVLLTQADQLWQVFTAMAILGIGGGTFWPNIEAELSRGREGPLLRKRLAVFNIMWCAGTLVGPLIGTQLYPSEVTMAGPHGREAINAVFWTGAALSVGVLVCTVLWRSRPPRAEEVDRHVQSEAPRDQVLLRTFMMMSFVANFTAHLVVTVLRQLYQKLAEHHWQGQGPADRQFWLLVVLATTGTAMFTLLYFAHRWSYRLKRYLVFQLAMALGLLMATMTANLALSVAGFVLVGLANSFIYSGSLFYSIEGTDETTHLAGWHEAVLGLGSLCGLLLSGYVPTMLGWLGISDPEWSIRSPYLAATAMFAVGIVVQLTIYISRHRRKA